MAQFVKAMELSYPSKYWRSSPIFIPNEILTLSFQILESSPIFILFEILALCL